MRIKDIRGPTGVALTGHFLARSVVAALEEHFLPVVSDMDAREIEAVHQRVWRSLNPRAMTGVVSSALSLLDICLWDIAGKHAGRSVAILPDRPGLGLTVDRDALRETLVTQERR